MTHQAMSVQEKSRALDVMAFTWAGVLKLAAAGGNAVAPVSPPSGQERFLARA